MRASASLLALPALGLAATIQPRALRDPWSAGLWKIAQGTDFFFFGTSIHAIEGKFFVNKGGESTQFTGGNSTVYLLPDQKQVYVADDGSLSYTEASAPLPEGAIATGFNREQSVAGGAPVYFYGADRTWFICPAGGEEEKDPKARPYQIFAGLNSERGEWEETCFWTQIRTYG